MHHSVNYETLCNNLLRAESEQEVTTILERAGLLDPKQWCVLGDMPNNRSMVNNQQQDPAGAFVEKIVNSIDAVLTKECFLQQTLPDSTAAPKSMAVAAEKFFSISDGNLANLRSDELTRMAENINVVATGDKRDPSYTIIDKGEGQTPSRFKDTFLSLVKSNKARIPFVQGKFNCGGTGVLPFCGTQAYELIISKRCPQIPSNPSSLTAKDADHDLWGFTILRKLLPSAGLYDTTVYVYLAPNGNIPSFKTNEIVVLPEINKESEGDEIADEGLLSDEGSKNKKAMPKPYQKGIAYGTIIKLYNYQWKARSIATTDLRFELERYLYNLCLPIRVVETRAGYKANYYATTVSGTAVTISKDQSKGYLEDNFPTGGELQPEGIGVLPISVVLYRERTKENKDAKDSRRLPKGLYMTINGQVHYSFGPEFFSTRGLSYHHIKETMLVTVDCTHLPQDIRDQLIMPSRDRLRKVAEFERIVDAIVADLKDRDVLRAINDQRRLRKTKEALSEEAVQDVFQSLINKNPVFASIFKNGKGLRNLYHPGQEPPAPPFKGKLPPSYFRFQNGKSELAKSVALDRTCAVELETDAINGYFELPNPLDRGELDIQPKCYERWNLLNGRLRIVFRPPVNARIGDSMKITITVTDPCRKAGGKEPWINKLTLAFAEGGKIQRREPEPRQPKQPKETESLGLPKINLVHRDQWIEHGFDEKSALKIIPLDDAGYEFYVNMDNTYLENELLRRNDSDKESAKFAYQWGLVLIAMGMLQELKKSPTVDRHREDDDEESATMPLEDQVGRFSMGVAAVIIPVVLNLMDSMTTSVKEQEIVGMV